MTGKESFGNMSKIPEIDNLESRHECASLRIKLNSDEISVKPGAGKAASKEAKWGPAMKSHGKS